LNPFLVAGAARLSPAFAIAQSVIDWQGTMPHPAMNED
jgi:hypothetical protein